MFWFQVVLAMAFLVSQSLRMLESTEGIVTSFFLCQGVFALLNLSLSISALRSTGPDHKQPKVQSVIIYAMWFIIMMAHLTIALSNMENWWKQSDWLTVQIVGCGVSITLFTVVFTGTSIQDPWIRCCLAIFLKGVPQVALAFTIKEYGKEGVSIAWMMIGHAGVITRLFHLWMSNRQNWNRNTKASFVSELGNEFTWSIATVAWFMT